VSGPADLPPLTADEIKAQIQQWVDAGLPDGRAGMVLAHAALFEVADPAAVREWAAALSARCQTVGPQGGHYGTWPDARPVALRGLALHVWCCTVPPENIRIEVF
jgi:hypothetical protein